MGYVVLAHNHMQSLWLIWNGAISFPLRLSLTIWFIITIRIENGYGPMGCGGGGVFHIYIKLIHGAISNMNQKKLYSLTIQNDFNLIPIRLWCEPSSQQPNYQPFNRKMNFNRFVLRQSSLLCGGHIHAKLILRWDGLNHDPIIGLWTKNEFSR